MNHSALLQVRNLKVYFQVKPGVFSPVRADLKAVEDVSFSIEANETLGLVGESGCGKTTVGRSVVRLIRPTAGSIVFEDTDLSQLEHSALRERRRRLQMIFQDPYSSLNPRLTVEDIVAEAIDIHGLATTRKERKKRVAELLVAVGLEPEYGRRYPHEFSGGQRQRIGIARTLAADPSLIVCDEPVSALDVSIQAQIINLLQDLQEQRGMAYLFIAHDLAVVGHISRRIMVMYLGRIVELAPARTLVSFPKHPYTQALISAVPTIEPSPRRARPPLTGELPSPIHPPSGCPFHPRCPIAERPRCQVERPLLREISEGHWVACHLAR